jgi:hypothetical protein
MLSVTAPLTEYIDEGQESVIRRYGASYVYNAGQYDDCVSLRKFCEWKKRFVEGETRVLNSHQLLQTERDRIPKTRVYSELIRFFFK